MFSVSSHNNTEAAVIKLLRGLKTNINAEAVVAELGKHADYPSLLSISDVLNNFNVNNSAYQVKPAEIGNIPISCPFIAHTKLNEGDFWVVNKMDAKNVYVSSEQWNNHRLSLTEFKKIFSGVVLTADKSNSSSNLKALNNSFTKFIRPAAIIGIAILFIALIITQTNYPGILTPGLLLLTLLKTIGVITSILLLIQSIDSNNPLVQRFCHGGNNSNCNAILGSKAAKAFGSLSWSEVGFFYFAGTWLLVLFGIQWILTWKTLLILNLVSLPYTFYSIYYQAKIAKQWCVLCCTVQVLLWLEAFTIFFSKEENIYLVPLQFRNTWQEFMGVLICMLLPVFLWIILKPYLSKLYQLPMLKDQLRKFKYNGELFNVMLTNQPKYTTPDEDWSIVLGNRNSNNIITMVSDPYCKPCSKIHRQLDKWLSQNNNLQARIIFAARNTTMPVTRHLMALNELDDKTIVKNALHDWYTLQKKDYEAWAKLYPIELKENEHQKLDEQGRWCKMADVTLTPTILINGYRLPDLYQLDDLKYIIM